MHLLTKLRELARTDQAPFTTRLIRNWKPKLICLILAILVWLWVERRYVQEGIDWDPETVRYSEP